MRSSASSPLVSSHFESCILECIWEKAATLFLLLPCYRTVYLHAKRSSLFLDSFLQEGIRQSLKIFIKQFNILEVQGMVPFQMTCCLCEWGIIANSFPASSSPSLLESSSSSHQHDRTFVFRTIYQTLGYCTFIYTHYLRCKSQALISAVTYSL